MVDASSTAAVREAAADAAMTHKIIPLQCIRGIGENFAAMLAREVFYRFFTNRRELASYVGIVPMPYRSGGMDRDRASAVGSSGPTDVR